MLSPIISKISDELPDVHFVSFDVEEAINTATELASEIFSTIHI